MAVEGDVTVFLFSFRYNTLYGAFYAESMSMGNKYYFTLKGNRIGGFKGGGKITVTAYYMKALFGININKILNIIGIITKEKHMLGCGL